MDILKTLIHTFVKDAQILVKPVMDPPITVSPAQEIYFSREKLAYMNAIKDFSRIISIILVINVLHNAKLVRITKLIVLHAIKGMNIILGVILVVKFKVFYQRKKNLNKSNSINRYSKHINNSRHKNS